MVKDPPTFASLFPHYSHIVVYFTMAKGFIVILLTLMATDIFTQPSNSVKSMLWKTPFQKHPHSYGAWYSKTLVSHLFSAALVTLATIASVAVALGAANKLAHVFWGKIFIFGWIWHLTDGLVTTFRRLIVSGLHEQNYPSPGFNLFTYLQFGFFACCIIDFVIDGIGNLKYKGRCTEELPPKSHQQFYIASTLCSICVGLGIIIFAIKKLFFGVQLGADNMESCVLVIVEFPVYIYVLFNQFQYWWNICEPSQVNMDNTIWLRRHSESMLFGGVITMLGFLGNFFFRFAKTYNAFIWATFEISSIVSIFVYTSRHAKIRNRLLVLNASQPALEYKMKLDKSKNI